MFLFPLKETIDILHAAIGTMGAVAKTGLKEPLIELFKALHDGYGDKVISNDGPIRRRIIIMM